MTRARGQLAQGIMEDLRWIGLERYQSALDKLDGQDLLYPCFCSRADILAVSCAPHGLSGEGPAYSGVCRNLSRQEAASKAMRRGAILSSNGQMGCFLISFHLDKLPKEPVILTMQFLKKLSALQR